MNPYAWQTKLDPDYLPTLQQFNRESHGLAWVPGNPRFGIQDFSHLMVLSETLAPKILSELDTSPFDPRADNFRRYDGLDRLIESDPFHTPQEQHPLLYQQYTTGTRAMQTHLKVMSEQAEAWAVQLKQSQPRERDYVMMCYEGLATILTGLFGFPTTTAAFLGESTRMISFSADPYAAPELLESAGRAVIAIWELYSPLLTDPSVRQAALRPYFEAGFSDDEIMQRAIWLTLAGIQNAAGTLYRLLIRLKEAPDQLKTLTDLRHDPKLLVARCKHAVNAGLHKDAAVGYIQRFVGQDAYELGDVVLPQGTTLVVIPSVVQNPEPFPFDIDRRGHSRVITFGGGGHWCVGEPVARNTVAFLLSSFVSHGLFDRFTLPVMEEPLRNSFFLTPSSAVGMF